MTLTGTTKPNNSAYDASADWMNAVTNAMNALLKITPLETAEGTGYVEIPENQDHVTVTHNIGALPVAVVADTMRCDVGRCWYDEFTVTANSIDIWVANPPINGSYQIPVLYYYR